MPERTCLAESSTAGRKGPREGAARAGGIPLPLLAPPVLAGARHLRAVRLLVQPHDEGKADLPAVRALMENRNMNTNENEPVLLIVKTAGNNFPLAMSRRVAKETIQKLHESIANPGENPRAKCLEWKDGTRIYTGAIQGWIIAPYEDPQKTAKEKLELDRKSVSLLQRIVEDADKTSGDLSNGDAWKNG